MSESEPDAFRSYARRCGAVLAAVVCGTLVMVGASYASLPSQGLKLGVVLAAACVNASLVAGYLMHLVTERRLIRALLIFTAIFAAGLMGLSILAAHDLPAVLNH